MKTNEKNDTREIEETCHNEEKIKIENRFQCEAKIF